MRFWRDYLVFLAFCAGLSNGFGQIDPFKRELVQLGYNAALEGHAPLSAYAFYYLNKPEFPRTNMTLRLAVAPTYVDSELGMGRVFGRYTDLGIGLAGGGFADSYSEIRGGKYLPEESFTGHGGEVNTSLYHLFNPGQTVPLNGVVRAFARYSLFERDDATAPDFKLPDDHGTLGVRTGLRWGGVEPILFPSLAMELSVWYEGLFRTEHERYGFSDRTLEPHSHLFWAQGLLAYTLPRLNHNFKVSVTAGSSIEADRFSAYRLGALLPFSTEFPLSLPGYFYQEISAREFVLLGGNYSIPFHHAGRWNFNVMAATAFVDYVPGLEQPGHMHSGVGGGILYKSSSWRVMLAYGYGIDAIRSHGRGGHSIGFLVQLDLSEAREAYFRPEPPSRWRGLQRILGVFGS